MISWSHQISVEFTLSLVVFPLLLGVGRVETQVCPIRRRPPPFYWPQTRSSTVLVMQPEIFTMTWIPPSLSNGSIWRSLKWNYTPLQWGHIPTIFFISVDLASQHKYALMELLIINVRTWSSAWYCSDIFINDWLLHNLTSNANKLIINRWTYQSFKTLKQCWVV